MTTRRRYSGLSEVGSSLESIRQVVSEMKQSLEVYERQRGEVADSFVRVSDLISMGVLSQAQYDAFARGETLATTELGAGRLRLIASPTLFNFDADGLPSPPSQTVQLVAVTTDLDGPLTWTATAYSATGISQGPVTMEIVGSQAALSVTGFGGAEYVIVEVRQLGLFDRVTISRSREGSAGAPGESAVTGSASRKSWSVVAQQDGTVLSFVGADGTFRVFKGTTEVTQDASFVATASGCTGTINNINDSPVFGAQKGYYQVTSLSGDVGTLSLVANYNGVIMQEDFVVTKSYAGFEIVSALPTTGNYQGRMVFLRSDNKLYRWDNSQWTSAVPTGDLIGTIGETQIQDGAISTPKLAANAVTAGKIAANSITANEIQTGTITAAQMATGTITAASGILADAVITSAKIGDLEVSSLKIQGSAVTTPKIAANAVTNQSYTNTSAVSPGTSLTYVVATALNYGSDAASFTLVRLDCEYSKTGFQVGEVQFYLRPYDNFIGAFIGPAEQITSKLIAWPTESVGAGDVYDQFNVRFYVPSWTNKLITFYIYATHTSADGFLFLHSVDLLAQEFKR